MRNLRVLGTILATVFFASGAQAQEFSVPKKPGKQAMFKKNIAVNKRDPKGYLGLQSVILAPLGDNAYAVLYGNLAGKRKGDSFHYFENLDVGFTCVGTGRPSATGGIVTNECFLNGGSTLANNK